MNMVESITKLQTMTRHRPRFNDLFEKQPQETSVRSVRTTQTSSNHLENISYSLQLKNIKPAQKAPKEELNTMKSHQNEPKHTKGSELGLPLPGSLTEVCSGLPRGTRWKELCWDFHGFYWRNFSKLLPRSFFPFKLLPRSFFVFFRGFPVASLGILGRIRILLWFWQVSRGIDQTEAFFWGDPQAARKNG